MNQSVHSLCLIHDDSAVIGSGFGIIRKALIESLRVALDKGDGGFQLVGNIGNKLLLAFGIFCLVLYVRLQLVVCGFKLRDGFLKAFRQSVHGISQDSYLVYGIAGISGSEIQSGNFLTELCQLIYGLCNPAAHEINDDGAAKHSEDTYEKKESVEEAYGFTQT